MTKLSRSFLALAAFALAVALLALPAAAQLVPFAGRLVDPTAVPSQTESTGILMPVDSPASPTPSVFGTSLWTVYTIGPCDGFIRTGSGAISQPDCFDVNASGATSASLGYPVHVPSGAKMQYTRLYYYENNINVRPSVGFYKVNHTTGASTLIQGMDPPTGTTVGNTMTQFGPFNDTVDNYTYTYNFLAILPGNTTGIVRLHQLMIYYMLQVSPAPGSATFNDVPTGHQYFQFIQALVSAGITTGCQASPPLYCPDQPVTRGQMAVFLARSLGLAYQY
jgi:hypothetical protein